MIERLLSSEVQDFIKGHQNNDPFLLSLNTKVDSKFPLKEAIEQIHARQKAKSKLPNWYANEKIIWPPLVSVEQSSSEQTAKFKASLLEGNSIADLTGGMGIDVTFFSEKFQKLVYVEPDGNLCELARHNFKVLEKEVHVHNAKAEDFLHGIVEQFDAIYLDPSRRSGKKKVFKIADCKPNMYDVLPSCIKRSKQTLVKLSPLVDLSLLINDFKPSDIWVVAVKGEVKEVLCLIQKTGDQVSIHAVDLANRSERPDFEFEWGAEAGADVKYAMPLQYLYEPSAAVMKTGAFKLLSERFDLYKLHQHTHLYTSDKLVQDFPGKVLMFHSYVKQSKKEVVKSILSKKINVITRNYPISSEQLKSKLGLKDGGDQFLIGTTLMNGKKVLLLCGKLD